MDLQEAETEEMVNDLEIDKDENIFDVLSLYRSYIYKSVCVIVVYLLYIFYLSVSI